MTPRVGRQSTSRLIRYLSWWTLTLWSRRDKPGAMPRHEVMKNPARRVGTPIAVAGGVLRNLVASATTITLLAAGCAAERPWPASPVAVSTTSFATQGAVATIDVLPFDLQLWAEPGYEGNVDDIRAGSELNVMRVALDALAKRSYTTGAIIDWNGDFAGGNALGKDDLLATVDSLAHYGAVAAQHPGQLPVPFLPARLGTATGADATLYLGGWAYVARHRDSAGEQIAKGIAIALVVVTVVALIDAATKSKSSSHRGGGGGGRAARAGASTGHSFGHHPVFAASRGIAHVRRGPRVGAAMADAFGRVALDIALTSPDWGADPALPYEGGESKMYLEATLVDNRTGLALWHAHQLFPASAASPEQTARVARTMFQMLPARLASPVATARGAAADRESSIQEEEHGDPGDAHVQPGEPRVARHPAVGLEPSR